MASISPYLQSALLNAVLRNQSYTSPTTVYLALWNGDPTSGGAEVSPARKPVTFTLTGAFETNNAPVNFPGMPVATVTYIGIHDTLGKGLGNLLLYGPLGAPTPTQAGDTFVVGNMNLSITVT